MLHNEPDIARLTADIQAAGDNATAAMYIARGKAYWNLGNRRLAINDYLAADTLQPDAEAARLLEITGKILDFRNTDLLNP